MYLENFANNLHKKGEYQKINEMEELQKKIEQNTYNGLAGAFITNGYKNKYDIIAMMYNKASALKQFTEGNIFYDNEKQKAVFITDSKLNIE